MTDQIDAFLLGADSVVRPDSGNGHQPDGRIGATVAIRQEFTPHTLADVGKTFRRWLYVPDATPIYVNIAATIANRLAGDPAWLLTVGPPGGGKTEVLQSLARLPNMHQAATLTEGALLSGTSRRETAAGAKGGLLTNQRLWHFARERLWVYPLAEQGHPWPYPASLPRSVRRRVDPACRHRWRPVPSLERQDRDDRRRDPAIDAHHAVMAILGERFRILPSARARGNEARQRRIETHWRGKEIRGEWPGQCKTCS